MKLKKTKISLNLKTLLLLVGLVFVFSNLMISAKNLNGKRDNFEIRNFVFPILEFNQFDLSENRTQEGIKKKIYVNNDTVSQNKILKVYSANNSDEFTVEIELKEEDIPIKIFIFNMLAKKVIDVYDGTPKGKEYPFYAGDLPNGVYLCILQGANFKHAKKFIISR